MRSFDIWFHSYRSEIYRSNAKLRKFVNTAKYLHDMSFDILMKYGTWPIGQKTEHEILRDRPWIWLCIQAISSKWNVTIIGSSNVFCNRLWCHQQKASAKESRYARIIFFTKFVGNIRGPPSMIHTCHFGDIHLSYQHVWGNRLYLVFIVWQG